MPNPFGPWEDRGFTVYLMTEWKNGKTAEVRTPDYVRDNIHPDLLGGVYSKFAEQVIATPRGLIKANPSGYVESQGNFAKRVAREVAARTGWPCVLEEIGRASCRERV